jgi:cellulose synthase/poly-beta-1,6-N-acetylglucosamine synthase-like glycosyltransferase
MLYILIFWIALQLIIGYQLVLPVLVFIFSLLQKTKQRPVKTRDADYAIIVTAYEQIDHITQTIKSILNLNYTNYLVYIVADKCDLSQLNFINERVIFLRPDATLASNTRSHFYAINHFKRAHERLTIIDSDNLVHPEYLNELNVYFDKGYQAVQGVREAKNLNTTYACLDAARDIYYHFYDGKLLFKAGSSATLAGSGMAFTTALYVDCLGKKDINGAGFDKVLQAAIVTKNLRIAFAEKAIVYDEKTSNTQQLVNQRSRWINTWIKYFSFGFKLTAKGILKPSWNQFLFGLILLRPPLFIFLILSVVFSIINLFINPLYALIWLAGLVVFVAGFLLALVSSNTNRLIYKSLKNIPNFIFYQLLSLLNARNANKRSVATRHYAPTTIHQILANDAN